MIAQHTARLSDVGLADAMLQIMASVGEWKDCDALLHVLEARARQLADAGITSGIVEAEISSIRRHSSHPGLVRLSLSEFVIRKSPAQAFPARPGSGAHPPGSIEPQVGMHPLNRHPDRDLSGVTRP